MRLVLLLVGACACTPSAPTASESLAWLAGDWSFRADDTTTTVERWRPAPGGALIGSGFVRVGERLYGFVETLAITTEGAGLVYTAWPGGQAPSQFSLKADGPQAFIATRPGPDFPTQIRYERADDGTLSVDASGPSQEQHEHWQLTPTENP